MGDDRPRSRSDLLVPPQSIVPPEVEAYRSALARAYANDATSHTKPKKRARQSYPRVDKQPPQVANPISKSPPLPPPAKHPTYHTNLLPPSLPFWNPSANDRQPLSPRRCGMTNNRQMLAYTNVSQPTQGSYQLHQRRSQGVDTRTQHMMNYPQQEASNVRRGTNTIGNSYATNDGADHHSASGLTLSYHNALRQRGVHMNENTATTNAPIPLAPKPNPSFQNAVHQRSMHTKENTAITNAPTPVSLSSSPGIIQHPKLPPQKKNSSAKNLCPSMKEVVWYIVSRIRLELLIVS